jgi:hypothetical protein
MNYDQRTAAIFQFLFNEADGLLRRYTAPESLSADRRRAEINDMVEDVNSEIPNGVTPERLHGILRDMAQFVRKEHGGRGWPTIKTLVRGVRAALHTPQMDSDDNTRGNRGNLSADQLRILEEKVLPTARAWLQKPGLAAQGKQTLEYWGETV